MIKPGDLPSTRAVVSNCRGMGVHLAGVLSDILEPLAICLSDPFHAVSTEDAISKFESYNQSVEDAVDEEYVSEMMKLKNQGP